MSRGAPVVTALRPRDRSRTAVELDGLAWRVLADDCVAEAGLAVGDSLTRERAVALARARRRHRAREAALRALERRDLAAADLDARLERRGVRAADRADVVQALQVAGLVDDRRFAASRAAQLAERGLGDGAVADDLRARGLDDDLVREAVAGLEPESERARRLVEQRGLSPRTLRVARGPRLCGGDAGAVRRRARRRGGCTVTAGRARPEGICQPMIDRLR